MNRNSPQIRKNKRTQRRLGGGSANPPQFSSNLRLKHRFRFQASGAFNAAITNSDIIAACGSICTIANAQVTSFALSVKIRKIEVWSAPASQGSGSTISIDWFGLGNSPNVEHSDTSLSVATNAHLVTRPPPASLASFWQKATATGVFTLVCPANSVVDIVLDILLADGELTQNVAVASGTLASTYFLALDQAGGTHVLVPVSMQTTF